MGARLSLLAPSAPTVAISSYIDILDDIQYIELINNSRFLKTIKAIDKTRGELIVIKILIKPPSTGTSNPILHINAITEAIAKEASLLASYSNLMGWHKIIETDRAGYVIRQFTKNNLYDRLATRPFLDKIEKLFLVFQMIKIVDDLHYTLHIQHGDIKLENFLVTSWNWILLGDFARYMKPTYIPEDNPSQYAFYFDSSDRRLCYLAPERFFNSKRTNTIDSGEDEIFGGKSSLTDSMDLFSLGCVIAEIYSDGEATFTLSQLFKYMKGEFEPDLSNVEDDNVKKIIQRLIAYDPLERPSAKEILEEYKSLCFPLFFYDFLYDFMAKLNDNSQFMTGDEYWVSVNDIKVDKIYKSFDKISEALRFDFFQEEESQITDYTHSMKLNLPGMPKDYKIKKSLYFVDNDYSQQASLIILNFIFSIMKTLSQPSSKIKACELILALSERISDECKLDRSLPYLCTIIDEYIENAATSYHQPVDQQSLSENFNISSRVICCALNAITTLLESCSSITPINALSFPEFLLPKLNGLLSASTKSNENDLIKITIAKCIPYLASVSEKFWMMSKTFKSDALKSYNNKVMVYSLENAHHENFDSNNALNISKDQLDNLFENISIALLTDPNPMVKMSLVTNILPLCQFFGFDKSNDIILPHLITYLNDPEYNLRLAFLSSLKDSGPFIGVMAFEQYLLPLLLQTLGDSEQLVVLKVLEIFNFFVKERVINPRDSNCLRIYQELLHNSIKLVLHPNEWIRQSVIFLVIAISENLSVADRYCHLYPLIKSYLLYDLTDITWNTLYPSMVKPLSKQVYEMATNWSLSATKKSLFWQSSGSSRQNTILRSFKDLSRDVGKSLYVAKGVSTDDISVRVSESIPLSAEDKQWLLKLKSVGLENSELWKLFTLKDYIYYVSRTKYHIESANKELFEAHSDSINIAPRNVFFDICYKSESIATSTKTTTEADVDQSLRSETSSLKGIGSRKDLGSLILPNFGKIKASLQTVQANVFGEIDSNHENSKNSKQHSHIHSMNDNRSSQKVFTISDWKVMTANIKHSYSGDNPFILKYLASLDFEPDLENFPEFGSFSKIQSFPKFNQWVPSGVEFATINSNNNNSQSDKITCISVCSSSEFFVVGFESGLLKVWDTSKLERNINFKNPSISIDLKSEITAIEFIPNRFVICVTTTNGVISLFRIDVIRGKNRNINKYSRLALIRRYQLNTESDGYILKLQFSMDSNAKMMIGITSTSRLMGLNILKLEVNLNVQNPFSYGILSSLMVGPNGTYALIGTEKGILCLWDLRFKSLLKAWKPKTRDRCFEIKSLSLLSNPAFLSKNDSASRSYFAMVGGFNEFDVTIWEIPSFECRFVLSMNPDPENQRSFQLTEIREKSMAFDSTDIYFGLMTEEEKPANKTEIVSTNYYHDESTNHFISNSSNGVTVLWNLNDLYQTAVLGAAKDSQISMKEINHTFTRVGVNFVVPNSPDPHQLNLHSASVKTSGKKRYDVTTDVELLRRPFGIILFVERSGYIKFCK